ncbi:putative holin-like toxin [Lactiplantibacillus plantarum]|nr:putative holin-like toxin [Lactiplantibacillus plantarum]RHF46201.1 putative holin-like toxin [Lactiplantibacillus plantarum]
MDYAGSFKGGGCLFPCEVRPWEHGIIFRKVSQSMSVFQALSLMLLFGTFLIALLSYIDKHHK